MDFQTADGAPSLTVKSYSMPNEKRVIEAFTKEGQRADDDFNFCIDPDVSDTADQVFTQYHGVENIAEALNYKINKTGWAYLVYEMGAPPSIISTYNLHKDTNFCMKEFFVQVSGR
ncbi:hypothetical protein OSTOST_14035 [Ostertagia ostertagi]